MLEVELTAMNITDVISITSPNEDIQASDKILTAANVITLCRLALIPVSLWLLVMEQNIQATILFAIAASTDFLDGMVARKTGSVTRLGQFLDPLVDRILVFAGVIGLLAVGRIPVWMVIVVIVRDAYLICGGVYLMSSRHVRVAVSYIGKASMWALCIGFAGLILNMPMLPGLGWVEVSWLPGFNSGPYCLFLWFAYLGVLLALAVAVVYTKKGIDALSVARVGEGGDR